MAVSVRMEPLLEKQLELAAKRKGVTKSQFIIEAVERALGHKNPYALLLQVEEEVAPYRLESDEGNVESEGAASTGEQVRQVLQAKHEAQARDWLEFQAAKKKGAAE